MKPSLACLLFGAIFLLSCERQEEKSVQSYLDATFQLYQEQGEDTTAIAKELTRGLTAYPDSVPLLLSRASLYCGRGMLSECRTDLQRLLKIQPTIIEARMTLCMLDEFEGTDKNTSENCYSEVVRQYAALPSAPSPELEVANSLNYVFALLMARHPDAEKEKSALLTRLGSEPQAHLYFEILNDFDRDIWLHKTLAQPWE